MIDISDGLASEALHISDRSTMGAVLYEEKLPIDPTVVTTAEVFNLDPTMCAISGGEDYELLFTIKQADYEKLKGGSNFTFIGHFEEGAAAQMVARDGSSHPITAQGWDAFLKRGE